MGAMHSPPMRQPCPPAPFARRSTHAVLLLVGLVGLAWACGAAKSKLYDRDISLSDAPLGRNIAREPLEGGLLDGWNALRAGDLAAAVTQLERHLKSNPRSAAAHYHLGLVHMDERRFALARRHLRRAAELEPNLFGAWSNLGVLYMRNGEDAAAVKALEHALGTAPKDPRVLGNLGNAWLRRGRRSAAIDAYERALKIAGEHGTLRYNLAIALAQRHQYAEANALLAQVLANRPGFALARALRVACLQGDSRVVAAIEQGRADLGLITPIAESHVVLGRALLADGKLEEGLAQLQAAVQLDAQHPIAVMSWGEALDAAGRRDEALTWYQRYLKLDDRRFEDTRRIRKRVRTLKKRAAS